MYNKEEIPRVPVVCTGNDFSTLYAPLIRDGRMEKFYWNPTREDRIGILTGIFKEDRLQPRDVETMVDSFQNQSIDFFGALRARVYDDKVGRRGGGGGGGGGGIGDDDDASLRLCLARSVNSSALSASRTLASASSTAVKAPFRSSFQT